MGTASQLATIDEMETLWAHLQREMTESGRVTRFNGTINMLSGEQKVDAELVRVGSFALLADGEYLNYDPDDGTIVELARQPGGPIHQYG